MIYASDLYDCQVIFVLAYGNALIIKFRIKSLLIFICRVFREPY